MDWTVTPLEAIGPLSLGAARSRVRNAAEQVGLELKHATESSDYFASDASVQVEHDDDERAWFIGINAVPSGFRLLFDGVDLFRANAERVFELFDRHEGAGARQLQSDGFTFERQIVALWRNDPKSGVWAQIAIGTPGYLNAIRALMSRA